MESGMKESEVEPVDHQVDGENNPVATAAAQTDVSEKGCIVLSLIRHAEASAQLFL